MSNNCSTNSTSRYEIIFGFIAMIPLMIYWGFVFKKFWQWFIVPLGVVQITLPWAIGIMIIFNMLIQPKNDNNSIIDSMLTSAMWISCLLCFGYVTSLFM